MRALKLFFVIAWLGTSAVQSAETSGGTPEQLVKDYMAALQKDGMAAVGQFLHPDELARFKSLMTPAFGTEKGASIMKGIFGPDATVASIQSMPALDFMNRFMAAVGTQMGDVKFTSIEVLGSVREADVEHVVARTGATMKEIVLKNMTVISCKKADGNWKLLLTGELEGLAAALQAK